MSKRRTQNRRRRRRIVMTRKMRGGDCEPCAIFPRPEIENMRGGACGPCANYTQPEMQELKQNGLADHQIEGLQNMGIPFNDIKKQLLEYREILPDMLFGHFFRWRGTHAGTQF